MKALILNSGMGTRMGMYTKEHPKCMTDLLNGETILSRQLNMLLQCGVKDIVITTGYFNDVLMQYCESLNLSLNYTFVLNPIYNETNYIYSIYCARELLKNEDIILMHGDLVFEKSVLRDILAFDKSCMKVSSTLPLPEKDFKAVVQNGTVQKIGIEFFENAVEAQALYKLNAAEWNKWLNRIITFCDEGKRKCYAEVAFNEISDECIIHTYDVKERLCTEIDTPEDWEKVLTLLKQI